MELKNVEIIKIGELKTFDSGFSLVEFVVRTKEEYPQELNLQANKEKAENVIKYNKVGDTVDCSINLRGRSWLKEGSPETDRKWFNTIEAWKVFKADVNDTPVTAFETVEVENVDKETDDLPF